MISRRAVLMLSALPAAIAGLVGFGAVRRRVNRYYDGPMSDHFDGTRFFLPGHDTPRSIWDLLTWLLGRERAAWPASAPANIVKPDAESQALKVTSVGHASFLLQVSGRNILLDPVWSARASPVSFAGPRRVNPPGIAFEDLPRIDAVLVSHGHYDHLDLETLARLHAAHAPRIIVPLGQDAIVTAGVPGARVTAHDWGDRVDLDGLAVHLEPMAHWTARGLFDRNHALWAAFVVEAPSAKVYFVGDSGFADGSTFAHVGKRHPALEVAILPIGAYEPRWFMKPQHMNPQEAVQAFRLCGARSAIGHHWGTFQLTDEAIDAPVKALADTLARDGIAPERFRPMRAGDVWTIEATVA